MAAGAGGPAALLAGLGGGGGLGGAQPAGQDPNELLAQIRDLLDQYLALGPDTPVAQQAQDLASAIDAHDVGDAGAGAGAAPPEGSAPEEAAETPEQESAEGDLPPLDQPDPNAYSGPDMGKARDGAKAFLKSKNKKTTKAV